MIYVLAIFIVVLAIAAIYALGGVLLALAWNFAAPLFWTAAPQLSWLHGVAIVFLLGVLRGLIRPTVTVEKKE